MAASWDWTKEDRQYHPKISTWLNREGWLEKPRAGGPPQSALKMIFPVKNHRTPEEEARLNEGADEVGAGDRRSQLSGNGVTDELRSRIEIVLANFSRRNDQEEEFLVDGQRAYVEQLLEELRTGKRMGLTTGFTFIDRWMGGLNCGELTTIVSAGGVGKSTLAMGPRGRVGRDGAMVLSERRARVRVDLETGDCRAV